MRQVRIGLVGGHDFTMHVDDAEADRIDGLVTAAMADPAAAGHLRVTPVEGTVVKVSLRDVVCLEIATQ